MSGGGRTARRLVATGSNSPPLLAQFARGWGVGDRGRSWMPVPAGSNSPLSARNERGGVGGGSGRGPPSGAVRCPSPILLPCPAPPKHKRRAPVGGPAPVRSSRLGPEGQWLRRTSRRPGHGPASLRGRVRVRTSPSVSIASASVPAAISGRPSSSASRHATIRGRVWRRVIPQAVARSRRARAAGCHCSRSRSSIVRVVLPARDPRAPQRGPASRVSVVVGRVAGARRTRVGRTARTAGRRARAGRAFVRPLARTARRRGRTDAYYPHPPAGFKTLVARRPSAPAPGGGGGGHHGHPSSGAAAPGCRPARGAARRGAVIPAAGGRRAAPGRRASPPPGSRRRCGAAPRSARSAPAARPRGCSGRSAAARGRCAPTPRARGAAGRRPTPRARCGAASRWRRASTMAMESSVVTCAPVSPSRCRSPIRPRMAGVLAPLTSSSSGHSGPCRSASVRARARSSGLRLRAARGQRHQPQHHQHRPLHGHPPSSEGVLDPPARPVDTEEITATGVLRRTRPPCRCP